MAPLNQKSPPAQQSPSRNEVQNNLKTVRAVWIVHFLLCFAVLCPGISSNEGRKYLPADPAKLKVSPQCRKAYVNAYASSPDDKGAIICCGEEQDEWAWLTGDYESLLCASKPSYLPFANTLTQFAEAWLLPLVPVFLRFAGGILSEVIGGSSSANKTLSTTTPRLVFYIAVMVFRTAILYVLLNQVVNGFVLLEATNACWYQDLLRRQKDGHCYGRWFDFSDHVVLFYAQVLPVAVFELLFLLASPYRPHSKSSWIEKNLHTLTSFLLIVWVLYLNFIAFLVVHKTAAYFHTPSEIAVGYVISLLVQLPLGYIHLSGEWNRVRKWVGLPSTGDHND